MPFTLAPQHETETASVVERLKQARSRYRSLISVRSITQWICFTLALTALAGYLDWRYHLPPLVRALTLASIISLGIILLYRRLIFPYRAVGDLFRVALRVEKKFPDLNDSLASAILFLEIPDEEKEQSSPYLRRETINCTQDACTDLNFNEAFTCRGTKRFLLAAFILIAASLWLVRATPLVAGISLQRLLFPFSPVAWPTKTRIEILEPQPMPSRLARGSTLELKVALGGVIPERARLMIAFEGGPAQEQFYSIPHDDQAKEAVFALRIDGQRITRDFRFQIKANDAETEWYAVAVRPAPVLVPLNGRPSPQIHLDYPEYTRLASVDLPDATSVVEAPAGTQVTLRAAIDRPIVKSWLAYQPEHNHLILASYLAPLASTHSFGYASSSRLSRDVWQTIPLQVADDGKIIDASFIPRLPGAYVLHFEDDTGLAGTRLFDFRIRPDPAPQVTLIRPSASRDNMVLLPSAEITLQAAAVDKIFGLKQVFLEYRISHTGPFRSIALFDASLLQTVLPKLAGLMPGVLPMPTNNLPGFYHFDVNQRIDLQRFTHVTGSPLQEGDVLILRVAANDFDTVNPIKQPGRSHEIELQIVGRSQLEAVIQQALANLRGELLQMRELQHEARSKVQGALKQQQSGSLRPEDMEKIAQAEQLQQQIRAGIQSPEDGLLAEAARLKQSVKDNQLPKSRSTDRIDAALGELGRIVGEEMDTIEQALTEARKPITKESTPLARAERSQKDVEETLKSLLERLEPWSGAGEVRGEARSILGELGRQIEQTEQLKQKQKAGSSGTKREQLNPEQQAELDHAALRPDRMGDRTRQLLEKIDRLILDKKSAIQQKEDLLQKKEAEAKTVAEQAQKMPMNSPEQKALQQRADDLREEAQQLAQNRDSLVAEMEALRKSISDSNGRQLKEQLQNVGDQVRQNRLEDAVKTQQTAKADLQKLIDSLEEKPSAAAEDLLSKKRKEASERLDQLIEKQDLLQKKIDSAQQIGDPNERREELQKLAREQEQLRQESEALAQKLTRLQSEPAAQDVRRAERQMAAARRQLEEGKVPEAVQDDALDHLDDAQDKLSETRSQDDTELLREKLTKMADLLRGIRDRQSSALAEAKRMDEGVKKAKGWAAEKSGAVLRTNLNNLIDQQDGLTKDLESLTEKRFRNFPVFERILKQSAQAMARSADRLKQRKEDALDQVDGTVTFDEAVETKAFEGIRANQQLALKRLDQLLDALKPDQELLESGKPAQPPGNPAQPNAPKKAGDGDDLPPLAQLKALRALQVDLAERTKAFDKAHPDGIMNLTEDELADLQALQEAQEDVANSIRDLTPTAPEGDLP